jgi:hypothetical protein
MAADGDSLLGPDVAGDASIASTTSQERRADENQAQVTTFEDLKRQIQ